MAEVFLARRRGAAGIAKRLVVKRVRQDLTSDPRFAEMFLREARVATALSHKNIVTVFDVGRDDEGLFLAMDFVDGPDLGAVIERANQRDRPLDPLLCAYIAAEVAAGLDHAHRLRDEEGGALGLVHRDVTPRNVLLSLDGEVKVTDFGVALLGGDGGAERRGTVPYMSPEQARGEPVDPRADLFALGLVLHELLTGRRVYRESGADKVLGLARAATVPPLGDDVPAALAATVARATATRREDRFDSARAMQRELASFTMAERGRRMLSEPPEHILAGELAELFPAWHEPGRDEPGLRPVGVAGTSTMRSVAETMGPEDLSATPTPEPAPAPAPAPATVPPVAARRAWPRWPLALAGLGIAGALAFMLVRREDTPRAEPVARQPAAHDPEPAHDVPSPSTVPDHEIATPTPTPTPPPDAAPHASHKRTPPAASGLLDLNAVPWAYVSIDGGPEVETPIRARKLSAGPHRVRIRNPVLERRRDMSVEISPGETSRYVVDLRQ